MTFTIDDVFASANISRAIEHLKSKKNACGDDGVWLHDLEEYWEMNGEQIVASIKGGAYEPQLAHEKIISGASGKHRQIVLYSSVDRLILRALAQILQRESEAFLSPNSFAYRSEKGVEIAVRKAAEYVSAGYEYVIDIDLKDFFDRIDHAILFARLKKMLRDDGVYRLIERYILFKVERDYRIETINEGILQGSSLSPVLSNIYLTGLDHWMEREGYAFIRFADDIKVYVDDIQKGYEELHKIRGKLQEYAMEINKNKSGVFSAFSRRILGYVFEKNGTSVIVKKYKPKKLRVLSGWHREAIQKIHHDYYIVNDGILTKKDFTALFQNEEKKIYIPVETTESINIYSNIEINAEFLKVLNGRRLNLNVYDRYGVYIGSFYTNSQRNRMKCLMRQVEVYRDDASRLNYAKKMDMAAIHNLRCNLKYYQKQRPADDLKEAIGYLSQGIKEMNEVQSVEKLLLVEARCRQKYYACFNEMIRGDGFRFRARTKRPPKDPINALISFGNVFLYQKIAQMIYKTGLDIRISFVHSAMKRYENLNLDIADIFKPIIVDRVIFTLINKRMIDERAHFEKHEGDGIYMNTEGKRILVGELENKLKQVITIKGQQLTYERVIMQEVRNLERDILGNGKYKPFKYQM